ncbi:hypothetical protein FA13DRAFT_1800876 [Coprinellus micaceus]|uniref:Uncharacterized protein n=1 Tax=Coprinellus micaceus TaxID=71717 RepID=A0A4Y7SFY4_COPMI|nr:hypothetical protein FA13DRAFT_1800876 [Coprinellus micaceus]
MSRRVKAILQLNLNRISMKTSEALDKQETIIYSKAQNNLQARRLRMCLRCQDKNLPCTGPNGIFGCSFCAAVQSKCRWLDLEKIMERKLAEEATRQTQEHIASTDAYLKEQFPQQFPEAVAKADT